MKVPYIILVATIIGTLASWCKAPGEALAGGSCGKADRRDSEVGCCGEEGPSFTPGAEDGGMSERAELVMGTLARVAIARGEDRAAAFETAFAAFRTVDAAMSLYRPESELSRLNAHAAAHAELVSPDLWALLVRARELSVATDGAFDVTILPLLRAFGAYRELSHLGAPGPIVVGFGGLQLDVGARAVRFGRAGMGLDLGGVAKGFALDRARLALAGAGVARARLDLGGNLAFVGEGPGGEWRIAVRDPGSPERALGVLSLESGSAVATSANYARDFAAEGWRAPSHVYDPRSWQPVRGALAVTVWAPDATTADALSTGFLVLGREGADAVLAREPEVGALFVEGTGRARRVTLCGRAPDDWNEVEPGPSAVLLE